MAGIRLQFQCSEIVLISDYQLQTLFQNKAMHRFFPLNSKMLRKKNFKLDDEGIQNK